MADRHAGPEAVVHIHQSGKAGKVHATPAQWRSMLDWHAQRAQVVTLTETPMAEARAAIAVWARQSGWHVWHPQGYGPAECTVLADVPLTATRARRLTRLTLRGARQAPIYDVSAVAYGIRWHSWHSPAHNGGLAPGWPTHVYMTAMATYRQVARRGRRPHVFAADWNADLLRPDVRAELLLPGMTWAVAPGQRPTEGGRVIDGVQTDAHVVERTATLAAADGFDHRGVLTVLGVPQEPRA